MYRSWLDTALKSDIVFRLVLDAAWPDEGVPIRLQCHQSYGWRGKQSNCALEGVGTKMLRSPFRSFP
jgi:hypothetical protein